MSEISGPKLSVAPSKIESMFGHLAPEALRSASDADVVAAVEGWSRDEAAAAARRLCAIAELVRRRTETDERARWSVDDWDECAAEVAAALGISHGRASGQMDLAHALRQRLPQVLMLFLNGRIGYRTVSAISWRTALVQDDDAIRLIDSELAEKATKWGPLSAGKLDQAIDVVVDRYDPGALRRTRASARSRHLEIGAPDDAAGTAPLWGRLHGTDAALADRRLREMAHGVCDDDPRTIAQRRADAFGALAAGADHLACKCGSPACAAEVDPRASSVVIHVLAEKAALECEPDPHMSGEAQARPVTPDTTGAEALVPAPPHRPGAKPPAALLLGGGAVPAPLLAELIKSGAKVRLMRDFCEATAEPGYRPSAALQEFVRMRDLTCRFPGCDRPADFTDIDHTIPWPQGPTHPSDLKCLCRKHHLLKTFRSGIGGWSDVQLPDGTVRWTAPTGKTYTTHPGSRLYSPAWSTTTAELPKISTPPPEDTGGRGVMMPMRRRTRADDRAARIKAERALNDAYVAERNRPPPF